MTADDCMLGHALVYVDSRVCRHVLQKLAQQRDELRAEADAVRRARESLQRDQDAVSADQARADKLKQMLEQDKQALEVRADSSLSWPCLHAVPCGE